MSPTKLSGWTICLTAAALSAAATGAADVPYTPPPGHADHARGGDAVGTGAASAPATKPAHAGMAHTRPAGSGVVSLDLFRDATVGGGSRVHRLTVDQPPAGRATLKYARSDDGGATFSATVPVGVGQAEPDPVHRGMDAQIAAAGDHVVAVWTTAGTEDRFGRGPLATAFSGDGGKTWKAGPNPADHGLGIGNAFIDLTADADGVFHCVWLDGRTGGMGKGLRYARSTDGGQTWSANQTVVAKTCECCWNTLATGPGGKVYVLFRQASPRDMAVVASNDGGKTWGPPSTAGGFGWQVNLCPHVGGGLAPSADAASTTLHAAVWTAKGGDAQGVYTLSSPDGGKTWGPPRAMATWRASHPDLVTAPGGRVAAAWDAMTDQGSVAIFAATSADDGKTWSEPRRLSDPNDGSATHPRLVPVAEGAGASFRVFYTQAGEGEATVLRSALLAAD